MAMVAGTPPAPRTSASISLAVRALVSAGSPWLMIVDSNATTPTPDAIASETSSDTWRGRFTRALCRTEGAEAVLVACVGDIMLDVIVDVPEGLVPDDDAAAH